MKAARRLSIGCSGYYYPLWKDKFYPEGVPKSKWLEYYSSIFNTVELNGTFYRLPRLTSLKKNHDTTPPGFTFSVKASRYITHILRLKNAGGVIGDFSALMEEGLEEKLDKILFQMPPSFKYTPEALDAVVTNIPHLSRNVIEFRHASWWNAHVKKALKEAGITFCNVSFPGLPVKYINTTSCFYLRMHGVPELFKSSYSRAQLRDFYERFPKRAREYHVYFNNTWFEAGYQNALSLIKMAKKF